MECWDVPQLHRLAARLRTLPSTTRIVRIDWGRVSHIDFRSFSEVAEELRRLHRRGVNVQCLGFDSYLLAIVLFSLLDRGSRAVRGGLRTAPRKGRDDADRRSDPASLAPGGFEELARSSKAAGAVRGKASRAKPKYRAAQVPSLLGVGRTLGPRPRRFESEGTSMGHKPVLAAATIESLVWDLDGLYVDGTIGCGGHARLILDRLSPRGFLLGFDWDAAMLETAAASLGDAGRFRLFQESFAEIGDRLAEEGRRAHGILLDLGLNSAALDDSGRGFRHSDPAAPLDMRMDRNRPGTAADLLNETSEEELARIFHDLGEARRPRAAARAIVRGPGGPPVADLGRSRASARTGPGRAGRSGRVVEDLPSHPPRGEPTSSMRSIGSSPRVADWLVPGGRLVVIAYESLSDRRVKSLQRSRSTRAEKPASAS